jgi:predicted phosphodiesterase
MALQKQTALAYLSRFPKAPTLTLAKLAYRENPSLWPRVEATRSTFRQARGANGDKLRKWAVPKFIRELGDPKKSPFRKVPKAISHFEDWGAFKIAGPLRMLGLWDLHCPYHDEAAIEIALRYGKERNPNLIFLGGDILDGHAVSFWQSDPRKRDFPAEIQCVKDTLTTIRMRFPNARIIYLLGNHEDRFVRYMETKAPELLGIADFELASILCLEELGIELIGENRPVMVGDLNLLHGHEYRFAISNPVNPARGLFLRAKTHCVCGHFHQSSQHSEKNLEGKVISTWSVGALCNLHPDYRPINNWSLGFLFAEIDKVGAFRVENLRIIHGKVY